MSCAGWGPAHRDARAGSVLSPRNSDALVEALVFRSWVRSGTSECEGTYLKGVSDVKRKVG